MIDVESWQARNLAPGFLGIFLFVSLATLSIAANPARTRVNVDHLVPAEQIVDPAYHKLLAEKLYATGANHLRVVMLPSTASVGEVALSLHSTDTGNAGVVALTCTSAHRNLWYAASQLSVDLALVPSVAIRRSDADFPSDLAVSLATAIRKMVRRSRQPHSSDRISVHGTHLLFSVEESTGTLQARLAPESAGPNSMALRRIVNFLERYCMAGSAERRSLRKRIKLETEQLHLNADGAK